MVCISFVKSFPDISNMQDAENTAPVDIPNIPTTVSKPVLQSIPQSATKLPMLSNARSLLQPTVMAASTIEPGMFKNNQINLNSFMDGILIS